MPHTLRFSLQNAIYFIMLPFLVHVLFTFYIQGAINLNVKLLSQRLMKYWASNTVLEKFPASVSKQPDMSVRNANFYHETVLTSPSCLSQTAVVNSFRAFDLLLAYL
jgi:hypothetical protein